MYWKDELDEPPMPGYCPRLGAFFPRQPTTLDLVNQGIDPATGKPFEDDGLAAHDLEGKKIDGWVFDEMESENG